MVSGGMTGLSEEVVNFELSHDKMLIVANLLIENIFKKKETVA